MNKRVNYNAREIVGNEWRRQGSGESPVRGASRGRAGKRIWLARVVFPRVQMTRQLLLNYTRHLDQSAQCQLWLILFIVVAMAVPADTERPPQKRTTGGLWFDIDRRSHDLYFYTKEGFVVILSILLLSICLGLYYISSNFIWLTKEISKNVTLMSASEVMLAVEWVGVKI